MRNESVRGGATTSDGIRNEYNKREFTTWPAKLDCTDRVHRDASRGKTMAR